MTVDDFPEFVEAIHDHPPFLWQIRLCRQVAESKSWPGTIAVPTGCGKTSVLDVAVFCLALQGPSLPNLPGPERWARVRTVFCVDRRLVVDEAFEHAGKIAGKLLSADSGILREAAANLRAYGGASPLKVARLRGGMYRDDTWADHPNQPLIVLSTVDQTGSRLLFRGYQVSDNQKPVHAGLMGLNTLIIVDEAHLSAPFIGTVGQVRDWPTQAGPLAPPLQLVVMSATPPAGSVGAFALEDADRAEPKIAERTGASKLAALAEVSEAAFPAKAAEQARAFAKDARVVGVVVNQVRSAREIFELLKKNGERDAILLTGRIRPFDRDRLISAYLPVIQVDSKSATRIYVVATQTVEVGANIDFDAMVTEAAPLSSLRQRFGRLHRVGNRDRGPAQAMVVKRKARKEADPVYGESLQITWDWLKDLVAGLPGGKIDFGFDALDRFAPPAGVNPRQPHPLRILPAHLEAWIQTNPRPFPEPDVAPFLHAEESSADVQIVWRADLGESAASWRDAVLCVPPKTAEALPVPFWAVRKWLAKGGSEASPVSDQEGAPPEEEQGKPQLDPVLVWRGPDDCGVHTAFRPGDTIVVPSSYGGCDKFGWNPESVEETADIGNDVGVEAPGRSRLRLWPAALPAALRVEAAALLERYRQGKEQEETDFTDLDYQAAELLKRAYPGSQEIGQPAWISDPGMLVFSHRRSFSAAAVASGQNDAEDDTSSMTAHPVTLDEHTRHVTAKAIELARSCGLPPHLIEDFARAARLHDLGKADPRFQKLLGATSPSELLAKSGKEISLVEYRRLAALLEYPLGYRHEFLSVALAPGSRHFREAHDRDLVLHLIGAHHGRGRALAPQVVDRSPFDVRVTVDDETLSASSAHEIGHLDSGWVERFFGLDEKFGSWGLAYLEAIFRRADCLASAEESPR